MQNILVHMVDKKCSFGNETTCRLDVSLRGAVVMRATLFTLLVIMPNKPKKVDHVQHLFCTVKNNNMYTYQLEVDNNTFYSHFKVYFLP